MTVFKAFLKVLNMCKVPIILYTVILIVFGSFSMNTGTGTGDFTESKPDVFIVNHDSGALAEGLVNYMSEHCVLFERSDIGDGDDAERDALFYREVNYIMYIPDGFGEGFMKGKAPDIEVRSTGDYYASYSEMMLSRYINTASLYAGFAENEEQLASLTAEALSVKVNVDTVSTLDTSAFEKGTHYFNFSTYSLLAGCVYVICLILSSFRSEKILKRTVISSTNIRKFNLQLLMSNALFAFVLWVFYVAISFILVGSDVMLSARGALFMLNAFVFTVCALTLAFFIGTVVTNKNAISGIVNVVALGTSFLCGAFVPAQWLPGFVLKIAHILPAYWYIQNNEYIGSAEKLEANTIMINIAAVIGFCVLFVMLSNIIARRKRRIG